MNERCWSTRSAASAPETMNSVCTPSNALRAASPSEYVAIARLAPARRGARAGSRTISRCGTPAAASSRATRPPTLPVDPVTARTPMRGRYRAAYSSDRASSERARDNGQITTHRHDRLDGSATGADSVSLGLSPTKGSILSGKHADFRPAPRGFSTRIANIAQFLPRRYVPLIASLTLAGVVLGASVAAMNLGPPTDTPTPTALGASAAPSSAAASRTGDERASRSGLRADPDPSPSSSPTPSPTKAAAPKAKPSQPSGGGTVTGSGSCGASYYSGGTNAD